jgi:hypothetical protein
MAFTLAPLQPVRPRSAAVVDQGLLFEQTWYGWLRDLIATLNSNQKKIAGVLNPGLTVTITTAKLTAGGANGSMTFTNGVLTAETLAT